MRLHLLLLALLVATVACGATPGSDDAAGDSAAPTGSWQLVDGEGPEGPIPALADHPVTLIFGDDGRISGTAACNHYFGDVTSDGDSVAVAEIGATEMACMPRAVMEAERRYLEALAVVAAVERSETELTLTGPGTRLVFAPLEG